MLGLGINMITGGGSGSPAFKSSGGNVNSYSISLDGANDYLSQPDGDNIFDDLNSGSWSLSFYVKLSSLNSFILWKGTYPTDFLSVSIDSGGDVKLWGLSSSATTVYASWNSNMSIDTWYHVVITSDGSGTNRSNLCYVNGSNISLNTQSSITSSTALETGTGATLFTAGSLYPYAYYQMNLDQIATWVTVLSASSILEIYSNNPTLTSNSGNYTDSARLQRYLKIEEGTGTTTAENSSNGGAAMTLVNGPVWSTNKPW